MKDFILAENAGKQAWQIITGDFYALGKASNFSGVCMTLVIQWFIELKFANGVAPDTLARYMLHGNFRRYGYSTVFKMQDHYGTIGDRSFVRHLSGAALECDNPENAASAAAHWRLVREKIYGIQRDSEAVQLVMNPQPYSGLLGLYGNNSWLIRKLGSPRWAHAVGIHCNGQKTYIFDPNYGVAIFDAQQWGPISQFFTAMWSDYKMNRGDLADITL
ncbi:YopT-type cysteine protease domain-containing protein [Insolitispirillum peregrinum]|nr:YopT-type cysteine protease domain-containing protein [Insolitispirillum peregrinum]